MDKELLKRISLFFNENEVYKIQSNLFMEKSNMKTIELLSITGENINILSSNMEIYEFINEKYKESILQKIDKILSKKSYIQLKCHFDEEEKHCKHYNFNIDNENVSFLDISFLLNEQNDILLYIIDKLFNDSISLEYVSIHDQYGRNTLKKDYLSYTLSTKNIKIIIDNIPNELNSKVHELVKNKKLKDGGSYVKSRYGKNS